MRFLDAFAPGKSIAALRIPHKGTSTEQRGCSMGQDPPRIKLCGFSGAMCRTKLLPRSVFHTREHPQSSGSARGARPASNQIMRFFRRNAPNKAFAALRIPLKGPSTEQRGCSRGQDPPRIRLCSFSGAMRRTKLLPRYVFRTREHPQSSGGARGGKARLELNSAVLSGAMCRIKPPRSCWLRGGPAVTGMGDATRT